MVDFLAVLSTTDAEDKARALAATAVELRLAACAQIDGPVTSVYRWEGRVATDTEWRVLYKTTAERYDELAAHIKGVHDYDTPEIIVTPITGGSDEYLAWLRSETSRPQTNS
ncbi:divalent-cation tolerance protein CutA [Streptomyces sp. NBC_01498]|nr:divalent-cation tolerance protein CutA [Streptomyces sp. NBC_01498]WTL28790.1 divalent-cation tolerance protein CutA [Streptomyces sp. NBC_01498]